MSYVRVSIKGTSVGNEVWSVNPVFDPTGEFPGWTQATADAAVAALSAVTVPPNLLVMLSTAFRITSIRMECREDTDDSLIGLAEYLKPTPVVGTGAGKMPPQCAQVVSLRTNTPGGSGRGRIYWPAAGVSVGSSLEASTPSQATTLGDFKTYFQALASSLATSYSPIGFNLAVRSRATHTTPHVTRMQMGNVIDTQRRRRDTLGEVYQTTTVP